MCQWHGCNTSFKQNITAATQYMRNVFTKLYKIDIILAISIRDRFELSHNM